MNQYSHMLCTVGSIVENDFENLAPEVIRSETLCVMLQHILRLFPLLVLILTEFSFKGVVGMLFNLLLDNVLVSNLVSIHTTHSEGKRRTEACIPDFFNTSISEAVSGWTTLPSFMYSFVASVSSVACHSLDECVDFKRRKSSS